MYIGISFFFLYINKYTHTINNKNNIFIIPTDIFRLLICLVIPVNKSIIGLINKNIETIDCFHIGDLNVDISEISQEYKTILNTRKI